MGLRDREMRLVMWLVGKWIDKYWRYNILDKIFIAMKSHKIIKTWKDDDYLDNLMKREYPTRHVYAHLRFTKTDLSLYSWSRESHNRVPDRKYAYWVYLSDDEYGIKEYNSEDDHMNFLQRALDDAWKQVATQLRHAYELDPAVEKQLRKKSRIFWKN